jgi:hypothetical protein
VYRIVITSLGHNRLATEERTPIHQALAALVSAPVEAASSRGLFDMFRARLDPRLGAAPSADASRALWQSLIEHGLIEVHGSSLTDTGISFAGREPPGGPRPSWWADSGALTLQPADRPSVQAPSPSDVPLIPQCITDWLRDTLVRLARPLWTAVQSGRGGSPNKSA